jgi:signal transduction histidine kinase
MRLPACLIPKTITGQITGLVVAAVLLGIGLTIAMILLFFQTSEGAGSPDAVATRIATVTALARSARSQAEVAALLDSARRAGMHVEQVDLSDLVPLQPRSTAVDQSLSARLTTRLIIDRLDDSYGITPQTGVAPLGNDGNMVVVGLNAHSALVFAPSTSMALSLARVILVPSLFFVSIIAVFVILLSAYAVRWVTSPLSSIAAAAQSFGRFSPDEPMLSDQGPHEISQVARALNDMRTRIRALVDDRTRMLIAISHDLRTPLTRLRLRTERVPDDTMRESMLHDIARIDEMLSETLTYLREGACREEIQGVDLPSLLQTVCTEFTDIGYAVSYDGPRHFAFACRPGSLTRAITNLVDNGTKHGTTVTVALRQPSGGHIEIDVSDDGPGIPSSLRAKVMEPFFKADHARASSQRSGFGLGLSIAHDIVRTHGGTLALLDRATGGLTARMSIPMDQEDRTTEGQLASEPNQIELSLEKSGTI